MPYVGNILKMRKWAPVDHDLGVTPEVILIFLSYFLFLLSLVFVYEKDDKAEDEEGSEYRHVIVSRLWVKQPMLFILIHQLCNPSSLFHFCIPKKLTNVSLKKFPIFQKSIKIYGFFF